MTIQHIAVGELLIDLECHMRTLGLWQEQRPSQQALNSTQPFAVDTLTFPQWVQFIFIEKMQNMVNEQLPLPDSCGIAPMCEEYFRHMDMAGAPITQVFVRLDELLTA